MKKYIEIGILKYDDKLYQNPWFLIKKMNGKYYLINAIININKMIIKNINLFLFLNKFFENFIKMQIKNNNFFFQIVIKSFLIKFARIL